MCSKKEKIFMFGKTKRMKRIFNESGKLLLVPMDHGVTLGPIDGLDKMENTISSLSSTGADSLILHKGMISQNADVLENKNMGLIMHLSGSTCLGNINKKILTGSVEDALRFGCDGVSMHINLGAEDEGYMIRDFAHISSECYKYGMPLIAMVYARGPKIKNGSDSSMIKHTVRFAEELGADIVKVSYTGSKESFIDVVNSSNIPIVIAGGDRLNNPGEVLRMICDAMSAGAEGVSMGRNIFQNNNIPAIMEAISSVIHKKKDLNEALSIYNLLRKSIA